MHGLIPLLNRKEPIMKSAVCIICRERGHPVQDTNSKTGDWIIFSDYQALEEHATGHPPGMEFFCSTHLPYAKCFSTMPAKQAISLLKQNLALYDLTPAVPKQSKWRRLIKKLYHS